MRRALDIIVVFAAVIIALLWWRGFPEQSPPPAQAPPEATAASAETPVVADPVNAVPVVPFDEVVPLDELEGIPFEKDDDLEAPPEYEFTWEEELRLREEQYRLEREELEEQWRRDAERRAAFDKYKSLRNQRISEARDRERRAQSAKANYEALRQHRRDCARTTKNGTYQAYGCEGINERVRKAGTDLANARNRRW